MPTANRLTIHIIAAMAEHEAEMISARTKAALRAAKARGTLLGSANPKIRDKAVAGLSRAAVVSAKQADQRADELVALVDGIRRAGATTLQSIADALNARGIPTARGGQWYPTTVRNAARRADRAVS